jgi:hypothetical protein
MSERDTAPADGLGLADAIGLLRDALLRARSAGAEVVEVIADLGGRAILAIGTGLVASCAAGWC